MRSNSWFVALALVATCLPCLLILIAAGLIADGAFVGLLGFLGVPWVVALVVAVPISAVLLALRLRPTLAT